MKPLFLSLSLFICCFIQAQSPAENLRKYDAYGRRLRSGFVYDAGDARLQGSWLPMECRRVSADGRVTAYWADGTWWLGHYVAVLATEYRRLQLEKDTPAAAAALADLQCALAVYDRLDCEAERCWGADTSTNAFYLRDDVPADFRDRFGVDEIHSDYARKCGDSESTANGPSQDQAWASYLGLALVRALVDDEAVKEQASRVAARLVRAMQHTDRSGKESWQVVNPVTGAILQPSTDIQWLKYAHAQAYKVLTGKACTFGDATAASSRQLWQLIQQNFTLDKRGHYNWYGVLALSAVINEKPALSGTTCNWLADKCSELSEMRPDLQQPLMFPHLPLINYLLYPEQKAKLLPDTLYENILNAAPAEGAHHHVWEGPSGRSAAPWHTLSLFCPWHEAENSDYNMLDYMLLYNLYRLVYAPEMPVGMPLAEKTAVSVRPNPAGEKVRLYFPECTDIRVCRLYGVDGRLLRQLEISAGELELDVSDLPAGFYCLQFTDGKRLLDVCKFVKK